MRTSGSGTVGATRDVIADGLVDIDPGAGQEPSTVPHVRAVPDHRRRQDSASTDRRADPDDRVTHLRPCADDGAVHQHRALDDSAGRHDRPCTHHRAAPYCCPGMDARTGHEIGYLVNAFKAAVEKRDLQREIEQLRRELAAARGTRSA